MVHDVVKLALAAAVVIVVIALVALLVTNYVSAFKPGGMVDKSKNSSGSSYTSSGVVTSKKTPQSTASPSPVPTGYPYIMGRPEYAGTEPVQTGSAEPVSAQPARPQQATDQQPGSAAGPGPGYARQPAGQPENATSPGSSRVPESSIAPETRQAIQPGMPDMSEYFPAEYFLAEYFLGWRAIIDQLFQMLPFIFSKQFGGMPAWPMWPC